MTGSCQHDMHKIGVPHSFWILYPKFLSAVVITICYSIFFVDVYVYRLVSHHSPLLAMQKIHTFNIYKWHKNSPSPW